MATAKQANKNMPDFPTRTIGPIGDPTGTINPNGTIEPTRPIDPTRPVNLSGAIGADASTGRSIARTWNAVWVSFYLTFVAIALLLRGSLPKAVLWRSFSGMRWFRRKYRERLSDISPEQGMCWVARLEGGPVSDRDARSRLRLYEDGRPIGPAHMLHDEIRTLGGGRFSHWGNALYFSTSDGSDPRDNGRAYEVVEQ